MATTKNYSLGGSEGGDSDHANTESSSLRDSVKDLIFGEDQIHKPRMCHLKKWPTFQGYGFNLHAERSRLGQHIGKVDAHSPAESAGLREGDRIVEVNFVNISNENHQQVVKRIRNGAPHTKKDIEGLEETVLNPDEVILLVLDPKADEFYKELHVVVKSDFENCQRITTADEQPGMETAKTSTETTAAEQDKKHQEEETTTSATAVAAVADTSATSDKENRDHHEENKSDNHYHQKIENNNNNNNVKRHSHSQAPPPPRAAGAEPEVSAQLPAAVLRSAISSNATTAKSKTSDSNISEHEKVDHHRQAKAVSSTSTHSGSGSGEDLYEMSAAEFRTYLKTKGRHDPRVNTVDMKQKYDLFQNM